MVFRVELRPRQRDEPIEVGAHHRVLGRRLRHALEAAQLLARLLLGLLGHLRLRRSPRAARRARPASSSSPSSFLMVLSCSRSTYSRWRSSILPCVCSPISRESFSTSTRCVRNSMTRSSRSRTFERLENRLLLRGLDVDEARDHVGERARRLDVLQRGRELRRHLRQQLDRFDRLLLEQRRARLDAGSFVVWSGIRSNRAARNGSPVRVVERAEALLALADQVMHAVRRFEIAHDRDRRADRGTDRRGPASSTLGIALQHDAELVAVLHGFLRGTHREVAGQRDLRHGAGEHDDVADGNDQQHVLGQRHGRRCRE